MKNTRSLRSQALDLLRLPLAVIVVIEHLFTLEDIALPNVVYKVSEYPMFVYVNVLVGAFLRGISVPIFFFLFHDMFFSLKHHLQLIYIKRNYRIGLRHC